VEEGARLLKDGFRMLMVGDLMVLAPALRHGLDSLRAARA
jgi:hypothetical protein